MRSQIGLTLLFCLTLGGSAAAQVEPNTGNKAAADDPSIRPHRLTVEFTSLRLMREKGIITDAEYDSAMRDVLDSNGAAGGDSLTLMLGRWSTTMYGFVEADNIWDSTESFNDSAGNASVVSGAKYGGGNGRFTMGVRNSRLGFRLRAPEYHRVRASAMIEADFLGNQAQIGYVSANAWQITEGAYFTNPSFRIRHMNLKLETPIVDIMFGQYWQLFGWQSVYHPNSVQIQGLPGQLYARTPQIRVSKTIKTEPVTLEIAAAMMRAPQRDSWLPEGQGGVRLAINKWTGVSTAGATGTGIQPLSVAVTADVRQFNIPPYSGKATDPTLGKTGWGVAADAFVPLIPGRKGHKNNALSVQGEFAWGYGIADMYTGLSAGALGTLNAPVPPTTKGGTATAFNPDVDPSLLVFDAAQVPRLINTESFLVGLQYYLPINDGRVWVSSNYSRLMSNDAIFLKQTNPTARKYEDFADANLFWDATPAVRLGFEYAWFHDVSAPDYSGTKDTFAVNHRYQLSAFYIF
jgi:hypothetical protein